MHRENVTTPLSVTTCSFIFTFRFSRFSAARLQGARSRCRYCSTTAAAPLVIHVRELAESEWRFKRKFYRISSTPRRGGQSVSDFWQIFCADKWKWKLHPMQLTPRQQPRRRDDSIDDKSPFWNATSRPPFAEYFALAQIKLPAVTNSSASPFSWKIIEDLYTPMLSPFLHRDFRFLYP